MEKIGRKSSAASGRGLHHGSANQADRRHRTTKQEYHRKISWLATPTGSMRTGTSPQSSSKMPTKPLATDT